MPAYAFSGPRRVQLDALLDTLIPPDDWPGGAAAGCGEYVARLLGSDLAGRTALVEGGLDELARAGFAALDAPARTRLVEELETGRAGADWPVAAREFVALLVNLAAEGYYADPGNGGNRDKRSWAMIGYPDWQPKG